MANKKLEVNVKHIIKDIEAGKFTSFQSILNETGGQHIYEAVNEELRKYLEENNAVMISATQLAHLRETGYKDFESERKALETQLKTATGDLKKQIESKLKDLKKFQYYSERKAPIGDELHKILELTDKGLVDLNDAVKAANQIMQQMQIDPHTNEKLKSLVGKTSADTMKNFRRAIKNAQDFQKMKISAGMIGGETETARSMAFKKDGKLYVVSGSTDWTKAKEGKIGDYKTTASFSAMHNLIQSVVNATLIRSQEGINLPITSKVAHLPITASRMKYPNTLPGVYDIDVGSYQEGVKLISDLIDVFEGRKSFIDVKVPGSVQGIAEKGPFTYKNEVREAMYYNGKPIGQWIGQTVEEVRSLLNSLRPQQRRQFLGSLFGQTDGKPWYNTENAKLLKEAFKEAYQKSQPDVNAYPTYGGKTLTGWNKAFESASEADKKVIADNLINELKNVIGIHKMSQDEIESFKKYQSLLQKQDEKIKKFSEELDYGDDDISDSKLWGRLSTEQTRNRLIESHHPSISDKVRHGAAYEIAAKLYYGEGKYYSKEFVNLIAKEIPEISREIVDIFDDELDKTRAGYLSGLSAEEKPQPSKYDVYAPDVWELEEQKQQAWLESGIERTKLGYADKPLFDDKGIKTLADRMTRLVDFYQRTTNIFNKVAEDINKELPADTQPYTGEELARTYLARKSPEVYDRYMRSKGLYEGFTAQAQGLPLEEQIQWIRKQLDTFIAEEGDLLNTFDTFAEIADQKSKDVFSKEFARKISYVGAPGGYVAPGTLYGLLMGSTFGVAQEGQMPEFDKLRGRDVYGRTLSTEAIDRLTESQVDSDIPKIVFYKQKLSEMTEELGVSAEKIGIFSDYLDRVQKVADQAGIELEQVLEGVDERGFIKEGSLLGKQLRVINEMPAESLYLPTSGKHGISGKARENLFGLFDDTGMESLATQYDIYLDEQDSKRKEELKKQNDIRVQKEQEFTKLVDTELENRLKFLYAETAKPDYIKAQEAAKRNEDMMGLSPEMFKEISGEGQKGLSIGNATEKVVEETEKLNEANEQLTETIEEETRVKQQSLEQAKAFNNIQDVRKRGKIDDSYDKWIVDRIVKNELGEVTDTIYKKARKSSGARGPSGISQVVDKVIPAVENIDKNIDEINKKIPSSFKDIDWESFQKIYDKMDVASDGSTGDSREKSPKSSGRKGRSNEEKARAAAEKQQKQDIREYQQYVNKVISLESQIDKLQKQAALSSGKHRDAIYGTIDALKDELGNLKYNNDALIKRVATEQELTKESIDATAALKKQSNEQKNLVGLKGATSLWDVMENDIKRATMRVFDFGIAAKVINGIPQAIQKIIQSTKELDNAMTNIRIVGGYTNEEAETLMRNYQKLGQQLGATTTEIAEGMNNWLRQGYEAEDQLEALVSASTKLSKLGMISASEATTALTSALKAFNLEAEDAIKIVDKLTRIDQLAAVSAGGISTALSKSATSAKLAGMSMDELISSVSVIGEVTQQSMDTVGNAMKSILARYGNVKASVFTQMGLDDNGETSENINDIEKVLSKLGIRMRLSEGEIRSITDILDEVNEKWNTFDTVTKNAIATAFGGTRMRENFLVLMENWDRVKELTEESADAIGSADKKYSAYTESIEASTKRIQNAWEGLSQSLEGSWLIKTGASSFAWIAENLQTLVGVIATFSAVRFSGEIFDFFKNTKQKAPSFFKKILGKTDAVMPITYDEKGKPIVAEAMDGRAGLLSKVNEKVVNAIDTNGQTTNDKLSQILDTIKVFFNKHDIKKDPITGEIIEPLSVNGREVEYRKNAKGVFGYYYKDSGNRVTGKNLKAVEEQRNAIMAYNNNLGTPAIPSQVSGYSKTTWWSGKAKNINVGDREYILGKDGVYRTFSGETLNAEQQKQVDQINEQLVRAKTQQRVKSGVSAGISTAAYQLMAQKQVGAASGGLGGALSKLIVGDNEQSVEETVGDKALRVGLSGIASAVGGAFLGPLGATIGGLLGEGFAGMFSTWFHRDELEMKQRVQDAKDNIKRLDSLNSLMEENSSIINEEIGSAEDYDELYKYTDTLYENLLDLQYEGNINMVDAINQAGEHLYGESGIQINKISDVVSSISDGNKKQRQMIAKQIELAEAQQSLEQLKASQEEERAKAAKAIGKGPSEYVFGFFNGQTGEEREQDITIADALVDLGFTRSSGSQGYARLGIKDLDPEQRYEAYQQAIEKINKLIENEAISKEYGQKAISKLRSETDEIDKAIENLSKMNEKVDQLSVRVAFLGTDIYDLTDVELEDLTIEGVVQRVAEELENLGVKVRDVSGYIKEDYQNAIERLIKTDNRFNVLQQASTKTLGQLTRAEERFGEMLKGNSELVEKYGKEWEKWYDAAKRGELSEEIAKIVYAANPERIEQFARAWNTTREGIEQLVKEFPNITTAIGLMSPSEVREYYSVFSDFFDDLVDDSTLTAENLEKLLTQYPQLLKYYKQGTLKTELIKGITKEQQAAYVNSIFSAEMSSSGVSEGFLQAIIDYSTGTSNIETDRLTSLTEGNVEAVKKALGSVKSLNEALDVATKLKKSNNKEDQETGKIIEELVGQYMDYEREIEWMDPEYEKAKQATIDNLQEQIDNLNEQKEALSKINDERKKEIELIKARDALENAKKEKKRVYRQGIIMPLSNYIG